MSDVLYKDTKYMNAEDALLAWEEKPRKRILGKMEGERWLELENDGKTDVLSPPLGSSQVSPRWQPRSTKSWYR